MSTQVAVLALSGWNKDKQPTTPKGMRWVRKAAEECRPLPKLEVVICVDINQCVGCTRQFFTKSFLGDNVAMLVPSSGEEPTPPRHRADVASMAWRSTRRFSANAP